MIKGIIVGIVALVSSTMVFATQGTMSNKDIEKIETDKEKMTTSNINKNKYIFEKAKNSTKTDTSSLKSSKGIDASSIGLNSAINEQLKKSQ